MQICRGMLLLRGVFQGLLCALKCSAELSSMQHLQLLDQLDQPDRPSFVRCCTGSSGTPCLVWSCSLVVTHGHGSQAVLQPVMRCQRPRIHSVQVCSGLLLLCIIFQGLLCALQCCTELWSRRPATCTGACTMNDLVTADFESVAEV